LKQISFRMQRANQLLTIYIRCHDEIFGFSLRKIIPIPFLFKRINYSQLLLALSAVSGELEGIGSETVESEPQSFQEYVQALHKTVEALSKICLKMMSKINGADYSAEAYSLDVEMYNRLAENYYAIGGKLNKELAG
jgi:hypothetical protein